MKKYNTALVTGGCQRIGLSIVKYLASKGLNIVVQYNKSSKEIRKIERIIKEYNVKFHSFKFDFENLESLEESYEKIIKKIELLAFNSKVKKKCLYKALLIINLKT